MPVAIVLGLALQALVLGLLVRGSGPSTDGSGTVVSGPNIENYVPAIQYNRGYKSALPIETTGAAEFASTTIESGLSIGNLGTQLSRVNSGTCTIRVTTLTINASSTQTVICQAGSGTELSPLAALPVFASGDVLFLQMSSTSNSGQNVGGGLLLLGARSSSTAGYIEARVFNDTHNTFTWSADASSSWSWLLVRPL